MLERFFKLREIIDIFMIESGRPVSELSDDFFIWKLAFLVDLTGHINNLNLKLQGKNSVICDLYCHVKAFRQKLKLFEKQLAVQKFDHFETCKELTQNNASFPIDFVISTLAKLRSEFENRFEDFDLAAKEIKLFQNPFGCDIDDVPSELQLEVIELTSNDLLQANFQEHSKGGNLLSFYSSLPEKDFKNLRNYARGMFSVFGSTYVCELTFSKVKYVKSKYRSSLSDEHLKSILSIGKTRFEPNWKDILSEKQFQSSH